MQVFTRSVEGNWTQEFVDDSRYPTSMMIYKTAAPVADSFDTVQLYFEFPVNMSSDVQDVLRRMVGCGYATECLTSTDGIGRVTAYSHPLFNGEFLTYTRSLVQRIPDCDYVCSLVTPTGFVYPMTLDAKVHL